MPPTWMARANCLRVDPEVFFPATGVGPGAATAVCDGCRVREQCLSFAQATGSEGIWGGTTERQRRALSRTRRVSA